MLELIAFYRNSTRQFNSVFVDPWFDNPISEYFMNQAMDAMLKAYYWPFYAATFEDKLKDFVNTYSICKI